MNSWALEAKYTEYAMKLLQFKDVRDNVSVSFKEWTALKIFSSLEQAIEYFADIPDKAHDLYSHRISNVVTGEVIPCEILQT